MKNKSLFGLFVVMLFCSIANAQSLVSYTWDTYKIKFKIADDMTVGDNNANKFEATSTHITLDIYPRKGENLTYTSMRTAIINWANQEKLNYNTYNTNNDEQPIYLKNLNGYWGYAIDGTRNSSDASMLLLVDPDFPDISFYIWIAYNDSYYNDALQILKSFSPM